MNVGGGFVVDDPAGAFTHKSAIDDVQRAPLLGGCGLGPLAARMRVRTEYPLAVLGVDGGEELAQHFGRCGLGVHRTVALLCEPTMHGGLAGLQAGVGPCCQAIMGNEFKVFVNECAGVGSDRVVGHYGLGGR